MYFTTKAENCLGKCRDKTYSKQLIALKYIIIMINECVNLWVVVGYSSLLNYKCTIHMKQFTYVYL